MVLLDLLGRRWALRILWELRAGPSSFRDLQARCGNLSPSVLNTRLAELRGAGLVETTDAGYQLSEAGRELGVHLLELDAWAAAWARRKRVA